MDISFLSKKEEAEDDGEKKIEFARKFDPNLGQEKKPPLPKEEKSAKEAAAAAEVLEEKESPAGGFFSKLLEKLRSSRETSWNKKGVLEVNLVKGEIVKYFDWQKGVLLFFLFVFISMSLVSLVYWGISYWGTKKQSAQNPVYIQNYLKINKEIKDHEDEVVEILEFKRRLDMANFLLNRHIYWSNFFDFLESNTLTHVYFSSFSGDVSGRYRLSATTNNFDAINAQTKKFLDSPYVKSAMVNSGSIQGEKGNAIVSFELSFVLNPEIFLKKK